jgi:hypothetical protein
MILDAAMASDKPDHDALDRHSADHPATNQTAKQHTRPKRSKRKKPTQQNQRRESKPKPPGYWSLNGAIQRCHNPRHKDYPNYGAAGVEVDPRWRGPNGYRNFIEDMGRPLSPRSSLDRDNNYGGYNKANCRWASPADQAANRRNTINIPCGSETLTIRQIAERQGRTQAQVRSDYRRGILFDAPDAQYAEAARDFIHRTTPVDVERQWRESTSKHRPDRPVVRFTRREQGVAESYVRSLIGHNPLEVLDFAVANWSAFVEHAEYAEGAFPVAHEPSFWFLAKYQQSALDLFKGSKIGSALDRFREIYNAEVAQAFPTLRLSSWSQTDRSSARRIASELSQWDGGFEVIVPAALRNWDSFTSYAEQYFGARHSPAYPTLSFLASQLTAALNFPRKLAEDQAYRAMQKTS